MTSECRWYNIEDFDNYNFGSYLVIAETEDDRYFAMMDYDDAIDYKNKCENDKKYISVSPVYKTNRASMNLMMGVRK